VGNGLDGSSIFLQSQRALACGRYSKQPLKSLIVLTIVL
jgi:hypothetical protein